MDAPSAVIRWMSLLPLLLEVKAIEALSGDQAALSETLIVRATACSSVPLVSVVKSAPSRVNASWPPGQGAARWRRFRCGRPVGVSCYH